MRKAKNVILPATTGLWLLGCLLPGRAARAQSDDRWLRTTDSNFTITYTAADADRLPAIRDALLQGTKTVKAFFGSPFAEPFTVRIFPNRAALTDFWRREWKVPDLQPQPWMVASGTAKTLSILSPRVWKTEAVEHDPDDAPRMRWLIAHEMVHVYHGQRNPRPDFDGMDAVAWFVEGLAVYASGQLADTHLASATEAIATGKAPRSLESAWTGKYRYGVCGSIIQYLDITYGRKTILTLLKGTSQAELLGMLHLTEDELLERWQNHAKRVVR